MKTYTDIKQSKKLAEILPIESADMRYGYIAPYECSDRMYDGGYDNVPYPKDFLAKNCNFSPEDYDGELPCWSLAALFNVLPNTLGYNSKILGWFDDSWHCEYMDEDGEDSKYGFSSDNQVDACFGMILKLHEIGMNYENIKNLS